MIFVAADDAGARSTVEQLIEEIGFTPVNTGSLHDGGLKQQPGTPVYTRPLKMAEAQAMLKG